MATAHFIELVVKMTNAHSDEEHIPMVIFNSPAIPDRTSYITGKSHQSPLNAMIDIGRKLTAHKVDFIAIPCVTSHFFYRELSEGIGIPILNMVAETAICLQGNSIRKVGLMATDGTITSGFFRRGLEEHGITVVEPSLEGQKRVMGIIYGGIKANKPWRMDDFSVVQEELRDRGAEVIVLGCTELSMIHRELQMRQGFLDVLEVLARKSVLLCSGRLKSEFNQLIG